MGILAIGTVALDSITTPFGEGQEILGGSVTHFSVAASFFTDLHLVAVIGDDFPEEHLTFLKSRKIDLEGLQRRPGPSFRWKGKYGFDLNTAITLKTELGVLETFHPKIPETLRSTPFVFLGNIDPTLQLEVINQISRPRLLALDTMNFWIEGKNEALKEVIRKVDAVIINEGEARELAKESSIAKAAKKILSWGPKILVVKRGEYGALLFQGNDLFSAPGLPLEEVLDPTGAGDSFAGGFMGYLSKTGDLSYKNLQRAVIAGSVMASFNVEDFSLNRLKRLKLDEIKGRAEKFKELSHFDSVIL